VLLIVKDITAGMTNEFEHITQLIDQTTAIFKEISQVDLH